MIKCKKTVNHGIFQCKRTAQADGKGSSWPYNNCVRMPSVPLFMPLIKMSNRTGSRPAATSRLLQNPTLAMVLSQLQMHLPLGSVLGKTNKSLKTAQRAPIKTWLVVQMLNDIRHIFLRKGCVVQGVEQVKCIGQVQPQQGSNSHLATFISLTLLSVGTFFIYVNVLTYLKVNILFFCLLARKTSCLIGI